MKTKSTAKPKRKASAHNRRVAAEINQLKQKALLPRQPVTNGRLAALWPAWCALPPAFDPTERDAILTGSQLHYGDYRQHYNGLRKRFKNLLPLDPAEYHETLNAASDWWRSMVAAPACISANQVEIERQLRYESFDKKLVGFMASHRMHKEFAVLRPDLLVRDKCPSLVDLDFVRSRRAAYARGRCDAVEILSGLIFSKALLAERDLPYESQSVEYSNSRFPRHLFVARLKAFGKCSARLLEQFTEQDLPRLNSKERAEFLKECVEPNVGREDYSYLRLWAWLAENATVFNFVKTGWQNIFNEVALRFKPGAPEGCRCHPLDQEHLKIQWRDFTRLHGLADPPRISLPTGAPRKDRLAIPSDLLTAVPTFSFSR